MKPATKIFSATAPVSCEISAGAGVDADDGDEHDQARGPRGCCARRSACCRRSAAATRSTTRSRPTPAGRRRCPGRPWSRRAGTAMAPIRKPRIMPSDERQQVGGGARPRDLAQQRRRACSTADLRPPTNSTSKRCSLVLRPSGIGTPPRSMWCSAICPANSACAELLQLLADHLLVGDQDLGLVERDVERLGVRHFGADQAHVVGHRLEPAAERDHVALLQHEVVGRRPGARRRARTLTTLYCGILAAGTGCTRLAGDLVVRQPVGAQRQRPVAGEAGVVDVRHAVLLLVLLAPPPWHRCPTSAAGTCRSG